MSWAGRVLPKAAIMGWVFLAQPFAIAVEAEPASDVAALEPVAVQTDTGGAVPAAGQELSAEEKEARFSQAMGLRDSGQYDQAVQMLRGLSGLERDAAKKQRATTFAGACLVGAKRYEEALVEYEAAIEMNAKDSWTAAALVNKGLALESLGRSDLALQAAERVLLEFPESEVIKDALVLRGRLQGLSSLEVEAIKTQAAQAQDVLRQVKFRVEEFSDHAGALKLLGSIEQDFPNTPAANAALPLKAEVLRKAGRLDEACAASIEVINRLEPIAPKAKVLDEVKYNLAESIFRQAEALYDQGARTPTGPAPGTWPQVRAYCNQVLKLGRNQRQMAEVRVMLVALELIEGRPERAAALAGVFKKQYGGIDKMNRFPKQVFTNYSYAAEAARLTGKSDRALALLEEAYKAHQRLDEKWLTNERVSSAFRQVCYRRFQLLVQTKADPSLIQAAADEIVKNYPDTSTAVGVQRMLAAMSKPAP